jgi:pimeloyl-ACP methyl ester carboxylesterase
MRRPRRWVRWGVTAVVVLVVSWLWWSEQHPEQERDLRTAVHDHLETWLLDELPAPRPLFGLVERSPGDGRVLAADTLPLATEALATLQRPPEVVLVHGLDEAGGIWDALVAALAGAGVSAWEFRYPNDQGIDRSADLLAEVWAALPADSPVYLVGHSMGGLVIRDFVTRWRHPDAALNAPPGPAVGGVILVATPNQGSEWARLRAWLELRELLINAQGSEFALIAGLREGTGAAKIDLRPGSRFLEALNARPWPAQVPMHSIGGVITVPTPSMQSSLDALAADFGSVELAGRIIAWWDELGEALGDGVVAVESLRLPGQAEPVIVQASHRGLLAHSLIDVADEPDTAPPAVQPVLDWLQAWLTDADPAR